ncbi:MAG: hypothetical protein FWE96_08805, partial [Coriobacteriia bacterium]|nr:hypothetical protein [Coriobacteriia bacterium]
MGKQTLSKQSTAKRLGSIALALILALTLCFSLSGGGIALAESTEPEPEDFNLGLVEDINFDDTTLDDITGGELTDDTEALEPDDLAEEPLTAPENSDSAASEEEAGSLIDPVTELGALVAATEEIVPFAAILSSDLSDFVGSVSIYDMNGTLITPTTPTFIGQSYEFVINFRETTQLQMEYDTNGMLTYQLPADLNIQNAVLQTPIYSSHSSHAIIGWYTISTSGLVSIWFGNVDLDGNPTPGNMNFIDYYANVNVTLSIFAQLVGAADGSIDFGNGIIGTIEPPQPPPPSLSMHKLSQYNPATQQINYMITITALGGPVTNLTLVDTPQINNSTLLNPAATNNAFTGALYGINGDTANLIALPLTWTIPPAAATFTAGTFTNAAGEPLVLQPGDFITIRYSLHLPALIDNNNGLGQTLQDMSNMFYDFSVNNAVTVGGDGVSDVTDTTNDHVKRELHLVKTGSFDSISNSILWSITVGDGVSIELNGGTITDFLGSGLMLPADSDITVQF